jgi:hypothetical protein
LHYNHISATLIRSILDRELDRIDLHNEQIASINSEGQLRPIIPFHSNIRGAEAYQ